MKGSMMRPEIVAKRAIERRALVEYLKSDCSEPFVFEHDTDYCASSVLVSSWRYSLRFAFRYAILSLAAWIPLSSIKVFLYRLLGMRIGRGVFISPQVVIDPMYPELIELEDGCLLGMGCRLLTHEYTTRNFRIGRVRVGKGAVVGGYSTVRSGVTIGNSAMVGFDSYVHRDVPEGATVGGVPARALSSSQEGK
jgi:acetyltransferase-like isoleucine patch superfamily enzyme